MRYERRRTSFALFDESVRDRPCGEDAAAMCRVEALDGLELIHARYVHHAFPPHLHRTYVIELVEQGCDVFDCAGRTHRAEAGRIIAYDPYQVHTGAPGDGALLQYRSLYPSLRLMEHVAGDLGWRARLPRFREKVIDDPPVFAALLDAHRDSLPVAGGRRAPSGLMAALSRLVERHATPVPPPCVRAAEHDAVTCARTFLLDHVQENTPTVRLAAECGVSPFHLVRTFHKDVGLPPHAYLNCVRVERAKRLLTRGLAIAEIARQIGFADQSHFTRIFSRIVGMSPGRYKDGNRVQDDGLAMCDA